MIELPTRVRSLPDIMVRSVKMMSIDLSGVREGDKVALVAEPTNRYDPSAIQVQGRDGDLLGYVPRDLAARIRAAEWTATVTAVLDFEGVPSGLRLRLDRRVTDDRGGGRP